MARIHLIISCIIISMRRCFIYYNNKEKILSCCNTRAVKCTLYVIIPCVLTVAAAKTAVIFAIFFRKYDDSCKIFATISCFWINTKK